MRLLDRYVLRECLGPFSLGLLVFTFMLLINLMFRLAEMILQRDVPAPLVLELLAASLPNILVLTLPMALLFGTLIAIGRLASDSELIAMRASGISLFGLYRPVMIFSLIATLFCTWLMLDAMPRGNSRVEAIYGEIFTLSVNKQVLPGIFYDGLSDKMLFVFEVRNDGWHGVFLTDALPGRQHDIQVARRGYVKVEDDGSTIHLDLTDTATHRVDLDDPERYILAPAEHTSAVLQDRILENEATRRENRTYLSMTIPELREWIAEPDRTEREVRLAKVEIHQKFAIPAACLVFGLFAVPLGFNNRRGGRSSGFALSIPIILVYRVIQSNGQGWARDGDIAPWLAMWLPNFVFLAAGAFLLTRMNRDKSLMFTRIDRWIRQIAWSSVRKRTRLRRQRKFRRAGTRERRLEERRRASSTDANGLDDDESDDLDPEHPTGPEHSASREPDVGLVLRLPRPRLAFPTLIDRYLLRIFFRVFVIVVLTGIGVYIMADLTELFGSIIDNEISFGTVIDYYEMSSFQIFKDLSPLVVLLTILISFGMLSRSSEIIAAKAAGLSLYRLSAPALAAAALVAGSNLVLENAVLPYSNAKAAEIRAKIKGKETPLQTFRRADRQWLYGKGGYIYHFQNFDPRVNRLQRLHVFQFDPSTHDLTARLYAQEARREGDAWVVSGAWAKTFDDGRVASSTQLVDGQGVDVPEPPEFFSMEIKAPAYMTPAELEDHIQGLEASGQDTQALKVQLYNKTAMPAISLIMCFVALPFAFRLGKKGALYGIGLAIGLGIIFYAAVAVFTTLGQAASLPPMIAAWSPHVLFASLSLYLFLGVET